MRSISSGVGAMKRAPAFAIVAKPGQPVPPPHSAAARPSMHHGGPVAGALEEDRLEVLHLVEPEPVEDVAGEDHEAGALRAERHRLAGEIGDAPGGAVGPDHEQPPASNTSP